MAHVTASQYLKELDDAEDCVDAYRKAQARVAAVERRNAVIAYITCGIAACVSLLYSANALVR